MQSSVPEEGTNRSQTAITATDGVVPILLKVVKEGTHKGGVYIRQC
jgi:hypothetical protein